MPRSRTTVVAVGTGLLLVCSSPFAGAQDAASDGKEIFLAQKCNVCHSVSTAAVEATTKSEKMKGPDLVDLEREASWIESYLQGEEALEGEKHKKKFSGSAEELAALVDWLLEQDS
jgi:mono/diheme cytochrome c family protein